MCGGACFRSVRATPLHIAHMRRAVCQRQPSFLFSTERNLSQSTSLQLLDYCVARSLFFWIGSECVCSQSLTQWRRSVVKYGGKGQSGQAIKLFQITPYVSDFQTFNNPASWPPVGVAKTYFYLLFLTPSLMMWNLSNYPTTVLNERMWHF